MELFLVILFISYFNLSISLPISPLEKYIKSECPSVKDKEDFFKHPVFNKCSSVNLTTINNSDFLKSELEDTNSNELLCALFLNNFLSVCKKVQHLPATEQSNQSDSSNEVVNACERLIEKSLIFKNNKIVCIKFCSESNGTILPQCALADLYGNYEITDLEAGKPKQVSGKDNLPKSGKSTSVENPQLVGAIEEDAGSIKAAAPVAPAIGTQNISKPAEEDLKDSPIQQTAGIINSTIIQNSNTATTINNTGVAAVVSSNGDINTPIAENHVVGSSEPVHTSLPEPYKEGPKVPPQEENPGQRGLSLETEALGMKDKTSGQTTVIKKVTTEGEGNVNPDGPLPDENHATNQDDADMKNSFPEQDDERQLDDDDINTDGDLVKETIDVKEEPKQEKPEKIEEDVSVSSSNIEDIDGESYFFSYFMVVCVLFVLGYIFYHNRTKVMALVLEGKRSKRQYRGRRPNSANYHKLDSNLEEAISSSCSKNSGSNIIY